MIDQEDAKAKRDLLQDLLDAARFRSWLESLDPSTVVGEPFNGARCPLAAYLHAHGLPQARVGEYHSFTSPLGGVESAGVDNPDWAASFIHAVDDLAGREDDAYNHDEPIQVTREQALEILSGVEGGR